MSQSSNLPTTVQAPTLYRALGLLTAMAVVVGNVIGSGIFLKPGAIAASSGNFSLIITVWVFGGVLCFLGALCIAELATMLPKAGGLYVYIREAYGRLPAFLFGWTEMLFSRPGSIGALAVAFVGAFAGMTNWQMPLSIEVLLATSLILGMAWINIVGVTWGGRVQVVTTIIKVVFLALVILSPLLWYPIAGSTFDVSNYSTTFTPENSSVAVQFGLVLLAVMWAYNGWHGITPLAEEVKEPQRNIPLALFGGIGLLMLLYVGANLTYHGVLSMSELAAAGEDGARVVLGRVMGQPGAQAMALVILCSTFGAINTNLLQAPRVNFAMGRDGVFFRGLGMIHARYRTPSISIIVTSTMAIGLIVAVAVAKVAFRDVRPESISWTLGQRLVASLHQNSIFTLLTNFVIFAASIFYLLAVLAVVVLRIRHPEWKRPYRTLGYPVVPLLFVAVYVWFLIQIYRGSPLEAHTGLVLIALGLPVYFAYRQSSRKIIE